MEKSKKLKISSKNFLEVIVGKFEDFHYLKLNFKFIKFIIYFVNFCILAYILLLIHLLFILI